VRFAELAEKEQFILTVCAKGYGKVSSAYEYRRIGRGGQGVTNIDNIERNGPVVASFPVHDGQQLMLVTDQAKLIRMPMDLRHQAESPQTADKTFRILGRSTAGVRLFDVAEDELIVSAVLIDEQEAPENEAEEAIVEEMIGRGSEETQPETPPQRDSDIEGEPGG
jgi:DNA gyrase subunit A